MIQSLKGMPDILPDDVEQWQQLEKILHTIAQRFGYSEIRTPILEQANLFIKSTGEHTDIVQKEFYRFEDKNGDEISLRPEGTPGSVRALLQHKLLAQKSPQKLYYIGPMFRRERPQKGRLRQFHQMGVEYYGSHSPSVDAEVISMLYQICLVLNIPSPKIMINSLGDACCRPHYRKALLTYLQKHESKLDATAKSRMQDNPMRIFDSKDESTQDIMRDAPVILDHLCDSCKQHFTEVCEQLNEMNIPFEVNTKIVRGLDYYTHTAFEVIASGLGSQNAVGGGGRYNQLIESLGEPATPAIGFALGMERLLMIADMPQISKQLKYVVLPIGEKSQRVANQVAWSIRCMGAQDLQIETVFEKSSMKSGLRAVNKLHADFVFIIGEQEVENETVVFKNLSNGEQTDVKQEELVAFLHAQLLNLNKKES